MASERVMAEPRSRVEGFRGLGPAASPLAWLYGAGVALRNLTFEIGLRSVFEPNVRTISVGGIEVGGVGKSPVAQHLIETLIAKGRRPALVSRGYGRCSKGLVMRRRGASARPSEIGDEPAMMVRAGLDIPVAVCARRRDAVEMLQAEDLADVVVLDDGFAHRALARHVEVVVLRAEAPLGNGRLLPAGTLREAPEGLRRANVLWFHAKRGLADEEAIASILALAPQAACVRSCGTLTGARDADGAEVSLEGRRVIAAAGIARPADFEHTLREAGLHVAFTHVLTDHHIFTAQDVATLRALREEYQADAVVVTSKDAVKLEGLWSDEPERWWVLGYGVQVTSGSDVLEQVLLSTVES